MSGRNKVRKRILSNSGVAGTATTAGLALKEDAANKATDFTTVNNTKFPTTQAVVNYVATALVGLLDYRGTFDASNGTAPSTGGSGTAGAILKADCWIVSVAGTILGTTVSVGDLVIAKIDSPANLEDWGFLEGNLGYTPENIANKATDWSSIDATKYPTVAAVDAQKMDKNIAINNQTADYTLVLTDNNKLIGMDKATAIILTIPPNADVAFPYDPSTQILGYQKGAGQVTITPGTGVTILSPGSKTKTSAQYAAFSLIKVAVNTWLLSGDLTT